ncbi:membrane integrity-associated transporter subunit PqiC [Variovorax sp. DXTD-1]|uniref:PqiC family protein n=1 Tax=Variovorax sp. DXTD-1 TaxID=2495592 RepID=UPI000F89CA40|nr:PqiC family protein [Variovorax sp. DXTD-1]RST52835.1 membrane integrity-associated transporter subunit PqiC [Variovorax sp. DXTD-1]
MKKKTTPPLLGAAAAALIVLAGCASKPDNYYTLASTVPAAEAAPSTIGTAAPIYIELAPVAVPERLARPQMVVGRSNGSVQVDVLEQHRWAASFESELQDALASGIAARLGALDVTKGGRQTSQPVWRIAVQVRQFDAVDGGRVDAGFSWTLRRTDETRTMVCQLNVGEGVASGIDAVAQAAQRITAAAAAAIARSVSAGRANPAATTCPA